MKRLLVIALALSAALFSNCKSGSKTWSDKAAAGNDIFAVMHTSEGDITIKLWPKLAPETVKNFVGLSSGEKEWKNPTTGQQVKGTPLYSGTVFHRVIPGFMIQGGDPMGNGMGDPGYRFADEANGQTFDRTGLLAMANAGPNTNGSQFFITTSTPTYLNGRHTIFGEVIKGYDIAEKISNVPQGPGNRPTTSVTIKQIELFDAQP